jgi:hypothetical protein
MKHRFEFYIGLAMGFGLKRKDKIYYLNIIIPFFYYEVAIPPKGYKIEALEK